MSLGQEEAGAISTSPIVIYPEAISFDDFVSSSRDSRSVYFFDTIDWSLGVFDHQGVGECDGCHQSAVPEDHYPFDCSTCHQDSGDWLAATYEHRGEEE